MMMTLSLLVRVESFSQLQRFTFSFKKVTEKAGLPLHYSIHSARHTYATILLAKTSNLRFVQKQLGHASLNMTSLYANILPEMNHDLANAILD
jgi:integrase/recombinase XerD